MAEPEDIAAALEPHHAILNDGMAEQLANHFWRDDLASVDASLLPGVVAARLADPQWANFRKPAVEPPPLHQPGSIGDIADRFKQRLGAGGRHPLGLTYHSTWTAATTRSPSARRGPNPRPLRRP